MKLRATTLTVLLAVSLALSACGGLSNEQTIATGVAQTLQISQLETAAANNQGNTVQPTQAADGEATSVGDPSATPEPTIGVALVSVTQDTNCRSGPSVQYRLVTTVAAGQQVEVIKTFAGSDYVVIKNPNANGDCWLWLRYANTSDFTAFDLPVATQPPTPTATLTPTPLPSFAGNWTGKSHNGASSYVDGINFTMSGNTISGTINWSTYTYTFTGTVTGNTVNGTWTSTVPSNGSWSAQLLNNNQFNGTIGNSWSFCGWRGGASEPAPCLWP